MWFATFRYKFWPKTNFLGRFCQKTDLCGLKWSPRRGTQQKRGAINMYTKHEKTRSPVLRVRREPKKPVITGKSMSAGQPQPVRKPVLPVRICPRAPAGGER